MKNLIQRLKERKFQLDQSRFNTLLKNPNVSARDRMAFAPHMLFFVMGFRDMLTSLSDEESTNEMQKVVNQHCIEDSTHWVWYLNDVRKLIDLSLVDPHALDPDRIWSEENWRIRNVVYETIHQCKQTKLPLQRLVIIQVLEATFDSFNDCICKPVEELGLMDELAYFGNVHLDAEEDHSFDNWLHVDEDTYGADLGVTKEEVSKGRFLIDRLFDVFEDMFDNWCEKAEESLQEISVAS